MKIVIPMSDKDSDPTEVAIPWQQLKERGHQILFASPDGQPPKADPRMLSDAGLGPWAFLLRARKDARDAYQNLSNQQEFRKPIPYKELIDLDFDGAIFPGGHAQGMKRYLESTELQTFIVALMKEKRPLAAICHGVVLVARSIDPDTHKSVLYGKRTTALPRSMELSAWALTALWLGRYYRTYPKTVQAEVIEALEKPEHFELGPQSLLRDRDDKLNRGFVVRDGHYLSARWPGDCYRFSQEFHQMLMESEQQTESKI